MGRFPPFSKGRVGLAENRDEPGFQPLAMLTEEKAGVIDMHVFDDLAERPPQDQPGRDKANCQNAGPDEKSHGRIPGYFPDTHERVLL